MWVRVSEIPDLIVSVCRGWLQSNPENTVGVMTMAGKGVRVLVTPTSDLGKILACMHGEFTHGFLSHLLLPWRLCSDTEENCAY